MAKKKEAVVAYDVEAILSKARTLEKKLASLLAEYEANKNDPVISRSIIAEIAKI